MTDQVVVIGSGPGFVKHVLDTTAGRRWPRTTTTRSSSTGSARPPATIFVDITAIREAVEKVVSASDPAGYKTYTTDIKPFLEPFDALIEAGSVSGDLTKSVVVITVH